MRSVVGLVAVLLALPAAAQSFVNWESPHVHPLDRTPDGTRLLAVNTADGRLAVLDLTTPFPELLAEVPVGLDPVSVRARSDREAWVVNHVSDTVSIVDLDTLAVIATVPTDDEPADVVFAGDPERAFVTCSQVNRLLVLDPGAPDSPPIRIEVDAEDPRALAVGPGGDEVYVAIFESGNGTTVLAGGGESVTGFGEGIGFPPNVVGESVTPYGGDNPPPNDPPGFEPPLSPTLPPPPAVGLIVRKDDAGRWRDDNGTDWSPFVSGEQATLSGRTIGWDLPDRDVAVLDTDTLQLRYLSRLTNLVMAIAVHPNRDEVTVVGTDATNEVRFEPVLRGRFLRVQLGAVDPAGGTPARVIDLNPHLDGAVGTLPPEERERSLGDPRGLVWSAAGDRGYVSGLGSSNVVELDGSGSRAEGVPPIEVGEGPTGLVLDEARGRLYVLNRFGASVSVVDTEAGVELARIPFFDPTPEAIRLGRRHLYDTHATSGQGQIACASCHVDARMDRLAWDLGDPGGAMLSADHQNLGRFNPLLTQFFEDWHPMKGPMVTQTLQDIIGHEPFHWRGDRDGIEAFNPAFTALQGRPEPLTTTEMAELKAFLDTLHFPPNPFRELDNTLPTSLPLPGHYTPDRFPPEGRPLPDGNARRALDDLYRPPFLIDRSLFACSTCHTLPTGMGTNRAQVGSPPRLEEIPPGPNGERHLALVAVDGSTNKTMKVPHLRNLHEKVGFDATRPTSRSGFGFIHDGSMDSLSRFLAEAVFQLADEQDLADLVALMLAFSGSDLPAAAGGELEPVGPSSQDTHAAVGSQVTLTDGQAPGGGILERIATLQALADTGAVGLVAHGRRDGIARGHAYLGDDLYQSDLESESLTADALRLSAAPGSEVTYTVVPAGSELRIGIDRDTDGFLDRDEIAACADPADSEVVPGTALDVEGGPLTGGRPHTFVVRCGVPGRTVALAYSLSGPGRTPTPFGDLDLDQALLLGTAIVDATGAAVVQRIVPPGATGRTLWWQAIDATSGDVTDVESTTVR